MHRLIGAVLLALVSLAPGPPPPAWQWTPQSSGVTARLRGVSAASDRVAWASGAGGTILRTVDGGASWRRLSISGAEKLDFRDIDAFDDQTAYALSIGSGEASRIYKTTDGGAHWDLQFTNREPKAFFDAMAFWDVSRGLAVSDSIDGRFLIILTRDGGRTWTPVPDDGLPPALPNEGAFAASGTNIAVLGPNAAWIGTGAAATARVLRSGDGGRTWRVASTPLVAGPSAGIFSIAFRDARHGAVVGGDYQREREAVHNLALTDDGGVTWALVQEHGLTGFRSVVAFVPRAPTASLVAVGPAGADFSRDGGRTWAPIEGPGFHAFSFAPSGKVGWGVGEQGTIGRLEQGTRD